MSRLHVEIYGLAEKTPQHLLLLHGWGMHGGVWQPLVKQLSRHFVLHVADFPGMGLSESIATPRQLPALAARLLQELPPEMDVCGWSLGGLVAMRMALMQPERVRRLVLVGSTPRFVNSSDCAAPWHYGVDAETFREFALQVSVDYQSTLLRFLTLQCQGAGNARSIIKQLRSSFTARPVPDVTALQDALHLLLENDLRPEVTLLRQPTLLVHGDRDTLAPLQAAHWMAQHLPSAALRVIAGASHAPFLSHGEQFAAALLQFLEVDTIL